ncbi:type II toxin-antitoxin system VapC family toxin [Treponema sp.]|uniref:type II toxin-antitoxin system VapC family toxin n=1 Tax=Treponema sp. TaxID=166 RepID=UPI00388F0ECD
MNRIYLLDTNIISEFLKSAPNMNVISRVEENKNRCAISSTTWNELIFGVQTMPDGKKKDMIFSFYVDTIQSIFPIIDYSSNCAWIHADLRSRLRQNGIQKSFQETQIAATAISNQMVLVTRNTADFEPIQNVSGNLVVENWFE